MMSAFRSTATSQCEVGVLCNIRGSQAKRRNHHAELNRSHENCSALEQGQTYWPEAALKPQEIWAIRIRLDMDKRMPNLALFNLAIDGKLRGCDLVALKVGDVLQGGVPAKRARIIQRKTGRPVRFEITNTTQESLAPLIGTAGLTPSDPLFRSRVGHSVPLSTRQYVRIIDSWVKSIGLNPEVYGTHSLRRTKASLIYRRTKNLRAVELLLGHSKLESTVRYLGIEVDDAREMAEQTEV